LVLVKPATVLGWHRRGLRDHARSGRPKTNAETRDLIRRMRSANPFWAAHGIHGELLKLGVEVSPASNLPRRRRAPSPNSRSFLHNHLRP
jgi:putative transposase